MLPVVEVSPIAAETTAPEVAEAPPPLAGDGVVATETAAEPTTPADEAAKEPEMIEVWRPGGHAGGERRPNNNRPRRSPRGAPAVAGAPAADGTAAPADGAPKDGAPRFRRPDRNDRQQRMERQAKSFEAKSFETKGVESKGAPSAQPNASTRPGQPPAHPASRPAFNKPGGRPGQSGRPGGGRGDFGGRPRRDKGDQVERAERDQYYAKPHGSASSSRDKAPDPNSPFAKLAALKQALEGSKE
jgi:ATP-dependent RNA helicase SUPV3L1/SUV3